jgi:hypothetical protein
MLPIQVYFSVSIQSLKHKELMFRAKDGWGNIERCFVGGIFGFVLVKLQEVIPIVGITAYNFIINKVPC